MRWGGCRRGGCLPLTRDELLESLALVRAVRRGRARPDRDAGRAARYSGAANRGGGRLRRLGRRRLYRHVPAGVAVSRSAAATSLTKSSRCLSDGIAPGNRTGAYLHRDRITSQVAGAAQRADRGDHVRRRDSGNGRLSRRDRRRANVRRHAQRRFRDREPDRRCVSAGQHVVADRVRARRRGDGARCARRAGDGAVLAGRSAGPDGGAVGGVFRAARRDLAGSRRRVAGARRSLGSKQNAAPIDGRPSRRRITSRRRGRRWDWCRRSGKSSSSGSSTSRAGCSW